MDFLNNIYIILGIIASAIAIILAIISGVKRARSLTQPKQPTQPEIIVPTRIRQPEKPKIKRIWVILVGISIPVILGGGIFLLFSQKILIPTFPTVQATQWAAVGGGPFSSSAKGRLVLDDPLADNTRGHNWQQSNDKFGGCKFSEDVYHVYAQDTGYYYDCVAFNTNFSNFSFAVNMKVVKGDCGGLLFRMEGNLNSYYHFVVCQNGKAMLARCDDKTKPCISILPFQSYSAINEGENKINLIAVIAVGNYIRLDVNYQDLKSINDDKHKQGKVGLEADPAENHATEVIYSDARVWTWGGC